MILLIDDEEQMDSYKLAFELSGFESQLITVPDDAWAFFNDNKEKIDLVVLDISLPPGELFKDDDTKVGLRTGVFFFNKLREVKPLLPILIFTNVTDESLIKKFDSEINCDFLRKDEVLPEDLVEEVKELLLKVEKIGQE